MIKIKIAFYKPEARDFWGNLIANYTGMFNPNVPKYCHCEIGFPRPSGEAGYNWYSSASRNWDGTTGTRWVDEKTLFKNPQRWDIYTVESLRSIEDMLAICNKEIGKGYDWYGIFGFVTLFGQINSKNKWYCSEICHYIFFGKWMKRVSPIAFYVEIRDRIIKG